MNPEVLASELNRDPFIPLRLHLADGRTLEIENPGLCFIARLALYAFRARPRDVLADRQANARTLNPGGIEAREFMEQRLLLLW